MLAVVIAEGVAIALLAVLVLGLLRSHALILRALHELGAGLELEKDAGRPRGGTAGAPARCRADRAGRRARHPARVQPAPPTSSGRTCAAGPPTSARRRRAGATLLAFLTSGCSVCLTFWEELGPGTRPRVARGSSSSPRAAREESPATPARARPAPGSRSSPSSGAWADYDIPGSPYFVLVEDGVVTGEGSATSWPQRARPAEQAVDESAHAERPPGAPARGGRGAAAGARTGSGRGGRSRRPEPDRRRAGRGRHPPRPPQPVRAGRPGDDDEAAAGDGHPSSPLVIGLPMAVIAAVRATWSP